MEDTQHTEQRILQQPPLRSREDKRWEPLGRMFLGSFFRTLGIGLALLIVIVVMINMHWLPGTKSCNISVRTLHGVLYTYPAGTGDETSSYALTRALEADDANSDIDAVILDIDSPGGYPVAGEEVAHALKRMTKPAVAVIRESGTSAAYWSATGASKIFASENSDVGGIAVISSLTNESVKDKQDGIVYQELVTGKFKDLGNPHRALTPAEHDLLMRDLDIIHAHFVAAVASGRGLLIGTVNALADGSSMTGDKAKEAGLVDMIGGIPEARDYLGNLLKIDPVLCDSEGSLPADFLGGSSR